MPYNNVKECGAQVELYTIIWLKLYTTFNKHEIEVGLVNIQKNPSPIHIVKEYDYFHQH